MFFFLCQEFSFSIANSAGSEKAERTCSFYEKVQYRMSPFFGADPLGHKYFSEGSETEDCGHLNVEIPSGPDLRSK